MPVSRLFKTEVKLNDRPAYRIAKEAGIHPCTLSQIMSGYIEVQPGDRRVAAVARVLGLDEVSCYE